jgi:ubiquinone/menaquinone biosynthesis C-methylase UbiE
MSSQAGGPEAARIQALARNQFAPVAAAYVTSSTHAAGSDLQRLVNLAEPEGHEILLDVATGGGHTALAFAPHIRMAVASDLTSEMLTAARAHISERGLRNVTYCRAAAEVLPFADASFDIVTCRVAAHHFGDVRAFVAEAGRLLRPRGMLLISDHISPADPELDAFMDRFERWRDPSHVRAYSYNEWHSLCTENRLTVIHQEDHQREPYEFPDWTARMRMPPTERDRLERWLLDAPAAFRKYFEISEADGRLRSLRGRFGIIVATR